MHKRSGSDPANVNEIHLYALRLLRARPYTVRKLQEKLETRFNHVPRELIDQFLRQNFLNDHRYAENYITKHKDHAAPFLREELINRGVPAALADESLAKTDWPALKDVVAEKISRLRMHVPLSRHDAARLFRTLVRLGFDQDTVQDEIEQLLV